MEQLDDELEAMSLSILKKQKTKFTFFWLILLTLIFTGFDSINYINFAEYNDSA